MRFSTAGTPRIICAAEEHPLHLALPRGCLNDLMELLSQQGSTLLVQDQRFVGDPVFLHFQGQLSEIHDEGCRGL